MRGGGGSCCRRGEAPKSRGAATRAEAATIPGEGGAEKPYETLGVERDAPQSEIRRAYRRLTLRLHPDKNKLMEDIALLAFQELVKAYEVIGNPDKRAAFDDFGGHSKEEEVSTHFGSMSRAVRRTRNFYTGHPLSHS